MNLDELTPNEIVDGFMLPSQLSEAEQNEAAQQLANARRQRAAKRTEEDKLYGQLMQLKIHMEEYIKQGTFDPQKTFASFLKTYITIQRKKKIEIATELSIHKTMLSQLLSEKREPSDQIYIRLEFHSNQFIPAEYWLNLAVKKHANSIMTNTLFRNKEKQQLKGYLELHI